METELVLAQNESALVTKEAERKALSKTIDEAGLTDDVVVDVLKEIMEDAITANPKTGEYFPDYSTRLQAVKTWHKFKSGSPDVQIQIANVFPGGNVL